MMEDHNVTMSKLTQDHESTIGNLQTSLEAEIDANTALAQEIEDVGKKLADEQSVTSLIAGLHATLEANLGSAQRTHKKEKAQLTEDLKCVSKMTEKLDNKVMNLTKSLKEATDEHEAAVTKMTEEHTATLAGMKASTATAEEEHKATVSKMTDEHDAARKMTEGRE